jgi:hypothetical protein
VDGLGQKGHVTAVSVAARGHESVLRERDVMADEEVVLVVQPHTFADPAIPSDVKFPGEADPRAWAENDTFCDVSAERS